MHVDRARRRTENRYQPREMRINAILASVMKLIVSAQLGQFVQRGWP